MDFQQTQCIDIKIWFGIDSGQILSIFYKSCLPVCQLPIRPSVFSFPDNNLSNVNGFSPNLGCALILWRSGLGLVMGKFCQFLTVTAHRTVVAGYY